MVRLKDAYSNAQDEIFEFQFQDGAVKSLQANTEFTYFWKFQFQDGAVKRETKPQNTISS